MNPFFQGKYPSLMELQRLLDPQQDPAPLFQAAKEAALGVFGNGIYIRGLVEFTNYCKNDCYYCGIRRSCKNLSRYRLEPAEILQRCSLGYRLGFRTFVLQGGEDPWYTDDRLCALVSAIRQQFPDCAITLSIGERSRDSYQRLRQAGVDRYLLRHETADMQHYATLHPPALSLQTRLQCLSHLKELGYQVGCGFMVGSPGQTLETLHQDLELIATLRPQMVGIGPFIPQKDTPFAGEAPGTLGRTLRLLAIIRLMNPKVLLPATTALGSIHPRGRELGILAGANVVMPNLSPEEVRGKYQLYDNKLATGLESAEGLERLKQQMASVGYEIVVDRGDAPSY